MMMMMLMMMMMITLMCAALHLRKTSLLVMDSRCRGGIVNIPFGCCGALPIRRTSPKALWRFRASTSNSPSGRSRLHSNTKIRYIDHTYAQQDIRVCEDDHLKPPLRQLPKSKALSLLRVSI